MGTVTEQAVEESLKKCMDPEVPLNIVEMGLVYGIDVTEDDDVNIRMTMTTQGCPLHETLVSDATRFVKKVPGVKEVKIDIVWDPPWSMEKMTDGARQKIKEMGAAMGTPAPINYDTAMPQGVGKLVKQDDGSLMLANEHEQGFLVNQAIVDFWRSCNGKRKVTDLVDVFASQTGLQRSQVEKEVMQLLQQLRDGGLVAVH
ncbi:MAG: PqqD family peptide modification chaperone [Nitrosopumilus sp.]|nr:PqqD family peptide modification chaperone [Nitrosopumilus sp.]MDA7942039.1 PqqD family peptide modification chaperone [Nitrosopumilus sp.]MDA7943089.1 PqqD family peptide modification chaperone [Nitrosopumilus sp.]MDA7945181.1 PqqD family peptide modification chaperone [Nitrosopumilus sp.]MDA7953572.1 PqqD family peptide modification chaperone [Nitrosopumilus sp.]